jgi:hypothetical protein
VYVSPVGELDVPRVLYVERCSADHCRRRVVEFRAEDVELLDPLPVDDLFVPLGVIEDTDPQRVAAAWKRQLGERAAHVMGTGPPTIPAPHNQDRVGGAFADPKEDRESALFVNVDNRADLEWLPRARYGGLRIRDLDGTELHRAGAG